MSAAVLAAQDSSFGEGSQTVQCSGPCSTDNGICDNAVVEGDIDAVMVPVERHGLDESLIRCGTKGKYLIISVKVDEVLKGAGYVANTQDIADYVKEHYGLYVHSMQIAMVRAKLGIKGHENRGHVYSTKTKPMPLPKDKEYAVTEALRYFGYIK